VFAISLANRAIGSATEVPFGFLPSITGLIFTAISITSFLYSFSDSLMFILLFYSLNNNLGKRYEFKLSNCKVI
tara:strand:- start:1910 stop:2131 length:222 start_codon:yes stop_codon:yes gene_type:complete